MRFLENTPSERHSSTSVIEENTYISSQIGHEDTPPDFTDESVSVSQELEPVPGTFSSIPERTMPLSESSEKSSTKKTTKRKKKDDDFITFLKERHENRNSQLELLRSQQPVDDISTFTKHIEMTLRKLSARSRAMAKNEIFSIVSKYEIGDIDGHSEHPHTSSSYNSYSPMSSPSSEHQKQNDLIDLSSRQSEHVSSEPFQNILSDVFDQNNFH